jgi:hypothetical protein
MPPEGAFPEKLGVQLFLHKFIPLIFILPISNSRSIDGIGIGVNHLGENWVGGWREAEGDRAKPR